MLRKIQVIHGRSLICICSFGLIERQSSSSTGEDAIYKLLCVIEGRLHVIRAPELALVVESSPAPFEVVEERPGITR